MPSEESPGPSTPSLIEIQRRVHAYWESKGVPARALGGRPDGPIFRFTEGPPTANGAPHVGHLVGRTLKDVQLRYRRMRGYRIVSPMAGWDCHGCPVELESEKRHGIRFQEGDRAVRGGPILRGVPGQHPRGRFGLGVDERPGGVLARLRPPLPHDVRPVHRERLVVAQGALRPRPPREGLLRLPYCPRCETPLSSHEVAQGYRETTDPSVTVRFP